MYYVFFLKVIKYIIGNNILEIIELLDFIFNFVKMTFLWKNNKTPILKKNNIENF